MEATALSKNKKTETKKKEKPKSIENNR